MIEPKRMKTYGPKMSEENIAFRFFLKDTVDDEETFDKNVNELHQQYFSEAFCRSCHNCCKMMGVCLENEQEVLNAANALRISNEAIQKRYLKKSEFGSYLSRRTPTCIFFQKDHCMLQDGKPDSCKDFPFTQKKERLLSLMSMMDAAEICPVAAQIVEDLKKIYHFDQEKETYLELLHAYD